MMTKHQEMWKFSHFGNLKTIQTTDRLSNLFSVTRLINKSTNNTKTHYIPTADFLRVIKLKSYYHVLTIISLNTKTLNLLSE